ncbi:TIGR00341 family protein [Salegentibacter sp. F188]|uniref:TIGR00341 family protein n=1 Tax=Autumnicola patrickiae TaxID=3075591 RepID=A0ABU3DXF2_9FLAO|nr:TIGR00341 family protein [Salegentibacter sp. F188]MDT0688402.1 TIGR00341 family protein [Salegentibacter sp. F188]
MLFLLYKPEDREQVEENILPLLKLEEVKTITYPVESLSPVEDDIFCCYLDSDDLREFLPQAARNDWKVGILPHPENTHTVKGLGLTNVMATAIEEITETRETRHLDMLFCNDVPVFQSVNIGNVFIFSKEKNSNNFFSEAYSFIKNIRRLSSLSHQPFAITAGDEKIINTSALGIIVVEHPLSSVVAKRLISENAMNDGLFNTLVLSPQNLLELLWFLFRSLIPLQKKISTLPSFIGHLRTAELKIENPAPVEFTLDGKKEEAKKIVLRLEQEALCIQQASIYCTTKDGPEQKKSLKTEGLPTGEKRKQLTKRTIPILPRATTEEFQDLFKLLRENSQTTSLYVVMMILSTLIATFGLFADSSPVIIGAMILAPIISPIVSFSMGMVRYDPNMLKQGIITILIGTGVSLLFAATVSVIIPLRITTPEIAARLSPTLLDMGIAVASGIAAAYAHAKEGIAKSLAGVAIAVALVPPLAVAGIGIGWWDWEVFSGAFLLYLTNLAGIIMFAGITFLILGFAPFKRARMGLIYTLIVIGVVMVPLSLSFNRIKKAANITQKLEGTTVNEVVVRDVKVRFSDTLRVSLTLVNSETLKSSEIKEIKDKIEDEIGEPINLEVVSARGF